ncbi:MAG: siderophore-interacting protein [Chloroflexi bacterium]|nr:siderophore-interacting protein [Chloroflexota bacterium]MDA1175028.1 siderophore-interacting protein [Chloroflexota bacterium]
MTTSPQPSAPRRKRPSPRIAEVVRVSQLTPHMIRVTFGGENLTGLVSKGPAEHVRIYLPNENTGVLTLPVPGPEGLEFPEDVERPKSRAYTPRRWNADTNELDVDFVIHGEGPASAWAAAAKAGETAVVSGQPSGAYLPEVDADWYVILGDEAALPAIATLLEALPATMQADVYIEVLNAQEEQELSGPAQTNITWLHRGNDHDLPGLLLIDAMRNADLPEGDGRVWVSAEASIMRQVRKHLLEDRQLDRSLIRTQGYWKHGDLNHTDHDMGDDV